MCSVTRSLADTVHGVVYFRKGSQTQLKLDAGVLLCSYISSEQILYYLEVFSEVMN
ncbi:unnamed protein product [Camellia sinensis]